MERKLQERMVGAGILLLLLVIVGPMILDGSPDDGVRVDAIPGQRSDELRTHTFQLNHSSPAEVVPASPGPAGAHPAAPVDARNAAGTAPPPAAVAARAEPPVADSVPQAPAPSAVVAPAAQVPAPPAKPAPPDPAPAPAAPQAAAGNAGWLVQVGTFGQKDNAERLASGLKKQGFAAFVSPTERSGKTLYRVRVGPSGTRESAAGVAGKLATAGQQGQVVAQ